MAWHSRAWEAGQLRVVGSVIRVRSDFAACSLAELCCLLPETIWKHLKVDCDQSRRQAGNVLGRKSVLGSLQSARLYVFLAFSVHRSVRTFQFISHYGVSTGLWCGGLAWFTTITKTTAAA